MSDRRHRALALNKFRRAVTRNHRTRYLARLRGLESLERRLCLSTLGPFPRIVQSTAVLTGSEARVVAGTQTDQFRSVGIIGDRFGGFCSGTLISPRDVVTAAHCAVGIGQQEGRFSVEGTTYRSATINVHPRYNDFTLDNDIAVFHLDSPVAQVDPSPIYRGTPRVGQVLTLVGYGAGGTGASGHTGDFGTKRVGLTPIDGVQDTLITWQFDNENESNTAPGDSGGAAFLTVNGRYYLAGITSGGDRWDAGFGDNSFDTRVDSFADWIDSNTDTETADSSNVDDTVAEETTVDDVITDHDSDDLVVDDDTVADDADQPLVEDDHVDSLGDEATEILIIDGVGIGQGVLDGPGDRDLFQLHVAEGATAVIQLTSTDGRLDTYLRLYDAIGTVIAENDDYGGSFNSQLQVDLEEGQYFVDVGAYADWGIGEYQVDLQVMAADVDPIQETELITLNSAGRTRLSDEIVSVGEVQSYSFVATRTGRMTVRTNRLSVGMDTMLAAYDSQGNELAFNDDWRGLKSRVRFEVQEGETYRVDVSGYQDHVGSFRLALRTREVAEPIFFAPSGVLHFDEPIEQAETMASDGLDFLSETADAVDSQFSEALNSPVLDGVWTEAEDWFTPALAGVSAVNSNVGEWFHTTLDLEVDWSNWFDHSWF